MLSRACGSVNRETSVFCSRQPSRSQPCHRAWVLTLARVRPTIRGRNVEQSLPTRDEEKRCPRKSRPQRPGPRSKLTKLFIDNKWMDPVDGGEFETTTRRPER